MDLVSVFLALLCVATVFVSGVAFTVMVFSGDFLVSLLVLGLSVVSFAVLIGVHLFRRFE